MIDAWSAFGERGLRDLSNVDKAVAGLRLVQEASEGAYADDGALLGALLRVRMGEGLNDHVRALLHRLKDSRAPGGSLLDAFAHIAALHAEGILLLTKPVLACALRCPTGTLKRKVLGPLGEEAVVTTSSQFVLVRHRAIAEVACRLLSEEFFVEFDEVYLRLVRSARELFLTGESVHDPGKWAYLSKHFAEKRNYLLAIRLAREVLRLEPANPFFIVQLSQLYRNSEQPEQAATLFRESIEVRGDRAYYYEWGTSEGFVGNYGRGAWLDGLAMADETDRKPVDQQRAVYCANGLVVAFRELYAQYALPAFLRALVGAAHIAHTLDRDGTFSSTEDRRRVQSSLQEHGAHHLGRDPGDDSVTAVAEGISAAWDHAEADLSPCPFAQRELPFSKLKQLMRNYSQTTQSKGRAGRST
jgi:tetratricopeptide (TPR) repeat protein